MIDPDGTEVFGYRGRDFADRTHDDDMLEALERLGLHAIEPPAGGPTIDGADVNQKGAFTPARFGVYFTGNKFGALAIGLRAEGDEAKSLAREHRTMSQSMLDAWAAINAR